MAKDLLLPVAPDGCTLRLDGHLCNRGEPHCDDHQCECGHRWPALSRPQVLRLQPDDVLVLAFDHPMSNAEAAKARALLEAEFPGHQALVINQAELLIVRPDAADAIKE